MGRAPCCEKVGLKRGRWTAEEDETLMKYIQANGEGSWRSLPKNAGLLRCGKSCRLRWINYLRADLKRGNISSEEEEMIIKLHSSLGNRWSLIAGHLPGRTDNEIKNYWNSHLSRRIHTFRRPISTSEPLTRVVMDLAKLNTVGPIIKRKGGRTSRASMKKNKKIISSLKNPKLMPPPPSSSILDQEKTNEDEEKEGSGYEGMTNDVLITHKSNQGKETLISAIEEQVEERESMVLDSYEEGEERESVLTSGHCRDSTGGGISEERENLILYNEEIESGFLMCPTYVEPAAGLLGPNNNGISMDIDQGMGTRSTGILNTFGTDDHERGNGVVSSLINSSTSSTTTTTTSSNDDQAAGGKKISSISAAGGDDHENWQFLYSSSCFDQDDWVHKNWDWNNWEAGSHVVEEDHLNVWGEKEEEMLSWLWESDHDNDIGGGGGLGGTTGDETLFKECEKQQALNAWLLS